MGESMSHSRAERPAAETSLDRGSSRRSAEKPEREAARRFVFVTSLRSSWHGAARGMAALISEVARRGHRVWVLTDTEDGELVVGLRAGGTTVLRWPSPRFNTLTSWFYLMRLLLTTRPHLVAATFGCVNAAMVGAMITGIRERIAWNQTLSTQIESDRIDRGLIFFAQRWSKALVYKAATRVVVLSKVAHHDLCGSFGVRPSKVKVLPYGLRDRGRQESLKPQETNVPVVLCVCRMYPSKGPQVLLEAAKHLAAGGVRFQVRFGGDGPLLDLLRQEARASAASHSVVFLGRLSDEQLAEELRRANVVVVPSIAESFGLLTLEAMAAGLPTVVFHGGAPSEMIEDGRTGMVVGEVSGIALAAALEKLLRCGPTCAEMGAAARQAFLSRFEERVCAGAAAEWLEGLVIGRDH